MMYSHICCCSSSNNFSMFIIIITSVLVLSLIIPAHNAQIDLDILYKGCSLYRNIDSPEPCGKPIRGRFDYPFWVDNRQPSHCGVEEFKLSCEDSDDLVVDIGSDNKYLVDEINSTTSVLKLRHHNDPPEHICAFTEISSTILNEKLYNYNLQNTEVLHLFHNCHFDTIWIEPNFTCSSGGNPIYFFTYSLLSKAQQTLKDELSRCQNTTLPFNKTVLRQFMDDPPKLSEDLFKAEFEVYYIINKTACDHCLLTGGLCWRGTNSVNHTCLYPKGNHKNSRVITAVVVSGCSILLLLAFVIYYCWIKTKYGTSLFSQKVSSYSKDVEAFIRQYGSSIPQRFRYSTLKKITNSFKDEVGKGGYGNVYRGRLADGRVVAVKVLHSSKGNGEDFVNEVASIGRTSHVNVVTLLGFCYEGNKRALIYEFMPNGSLEKFIHGATPLLEGQHLGWEKLYGIAIGIARGLEYLHRGCNIRIVHFDIKPHNILLDEDFCPKISDFGLAKSYSAKESAVSSLLQARGTIGYIAPEVTSRNFGQVSHKSDVYSYGMMILEMVGGRKNVDAKIDHTSEIYYPRWLYKRIQFDDVLNMGSEISKEGNELVRKMVIVGLWCIQIHPSQRPSMGKVIEMLEGQISALEIPPSPYLCSVPTSPSNSQTKMAYYSSGTNSSLSPSLVPQSSHNI